MRRPDDGPGAGPPAMTIEGAHRRLTAPGAPFEMEEVTIAGRITRTWRHGPKTLLDVIEAGRLHGERTFLVHEDETASFEAFSRAVTALAWDLLARGVVKGDRVAIAMRNLPEWPVAFFAGATVGAVSAPLNAWWSGAELAYGLQDSGASVLVADQERFERLQPHLHECPELRVIYIARSPAIVGTTSLTELIGPPSRWSRLTDQPAPDVPVGPEDGATLFYTSGTTGRPKGAFGTHRNITFNLQAAAFVRARTLLRRGEEPPAPTDDTPRKVFLLSVPLFHVTGCHASLQPALFYGHKLVLMRRWDVESGVDLIERERVTHAGGVPTVAWQIVEHASQAGRDLSSLESLSFGGAPPPPELAERIRDVLPGCDPGNGWGMTETSCLLTSNQGEDYIRRPESCGVAVPVCDVAVFGPDGAVLEFGEVGEFWARGPNVVQGYWRAPAATADVFRDGWIRTGDIGRMDAEGFCYLLDRAKDVVIRGGENIYCPEVEHILNSHPAVREAAVLGVKSQVLGEEPVAAVVLNSGLQVSEGELQAFVRSRIAAFKSPVSIAFTPDPLPRNPSGKILKQELKALFQG